MKRLTPALGALLLALLPVAAFAQGFIRLQPVYTTDTISANADFMLLSAEKVGGFGSVKIQTLDTYSGTWEVQCSLNGTTFDADAELKMAASDGSTTVTSVTDTVGIWDVQNAGGCRVIKLIATAGFAASDVAVVISATQAGGGGGGAGEVTLGDITIDLTATNAVLTEIETAVDGLETLGAAALTSAVFNAALGTAGTADSQVLSVQGIASMTPILATVSDGAGALNVIVDSSATVTVAASDLDVQSGGADILSTTAFNAALGTAGTADSQVLSVQGIASMTPILATVTATNLDVQIGGSDTVAVSNAGLTELAAAINSSLVDVNIVSSSVGAGGTAVADDADFTAGTTTFTPVGGFYQSTVTACTDGDTCAAGITTGRALKVIISDAAGAAQTIASDMTVGTAFGTTGPGRLAMYQDFDGAALATATNVDTELEAVPLSASIKGVQYVMVVSEDGALERGTATTPYIVGDGTGALNVICDSGCSGGTQYAEDAVHASGNTGTLALVVRNDAGTALAADGDNIPLMVNSAGALFVQANVTDGSGALNVICDSGCSGGTQYAEDAVHASGNTGTLALAVRNDALTALAADGDNIPLMMDASGRLVVSDGTGALNVIVDSGTITAVSTVTNISQFGAAAINLGVGTVGTGTLRMVIAQDDPVNDAAVKLDAQMVAHDAADAGNAVKIGGYASTAPPTAVSAAADRVNAWYTLNGAAVVSPGGGLAHYRTSAGSTEDEHEIKATAGTLYSILITNTNAAARYIRCYNLTAANTTPGTSTVFWGAAIPGATAGAGFTYSFPAGLTFDTALTCAWTTGAADTDVAEVAANEIKATYTYR